MHISPRAIWDEWFSGQFISFQLNIFTKSLLLSFIFVSENLSKVTPIVSFCLIIHITCALSILYYNCLCSSIWILLLISPDSLKLSSMLSWLSHLKLYFKVIPCKFYSENIHLDSHLPFEVFYHLFYFLKKEK